MAEVYQFHRNCWLSIRVSPSHPYNAGKAGVLTGPGWGGRWLRGNVYDASSDLVVVLELRVSCLGIFCEKVSRGPLSDFIIEL